MFYNLNGFWIRFVLILSIYFHAICIVKANPTANQYWMDVPAEIRSGLGRDRAPLENNQSIDTQNFIKKYFYDDQSIISLKKVNLMFDRIKKEKEVLIKD